MLEHIRRNRERGHRSGLETKVEEALQKQGLSFSYEKESFVYYRKGRYTPDFTIDGEHPFHIEVKGYWFPQDRSKVLATIIANPDMRLLVALQRPFMTISKKSKTSYAAWCTKNGIPWCSIPIPEDFINQWLSGSRCTMHVTDANQATVHQPTMKGGHIALSANKTTDEMNPNQTSLSLMQCNQQIE
jgi:hypothetical protein